jgi:hypothetical protein
MRGETEVIVVMKENSRNQRRPATAHARQPKEWRNVTR